MKILGGINGRFRARPGSKQDNTTQTLRSDKSTKTDSPFGIFIKYYRKQRAKTCTSEILKKFCSKKTNRFLQSAQTSVLKDYDATYFYLFLFYLFKHFLLQSVS